jgi:hypothetical protein
MKHVASNKLHKELDNGRLAQWDTMPGNVRLTSRLGFEPSREVFRRYGSDRTAFVERLLPRVFDGRFFSAGVSPDNLPFDTLERLVWIDFSTIRVEEDRSRASGEAYSPDERDSAEEAHGAAFNRLAETPGRATFQALLRLPKHPYCAIPSSRLHAIAFNRAAQDSESALWRPTEPHEFERSFETGPQTARDLQRVAIGGVADIQHDVLHGDFAQGATVSSLPNKTALQNRAADRLRLKQGRAYSIEPEPNVVEEKEPDVRFRAKASDASVAMDIEVADVGQCCSWRLRSRTSYADDM